jgi:pimeloyl-ACP methyl ester carboxylesterase
MKRLAWAGLIVATGGLAGIVLAYRFALEYRRRAGLPSPTVVDTSPADFGLAFEAAEIPSGDAGELRLAGWFVPAGDKGGKIGSKLLRRPQRPDPRPAVVVVHGWESNRGRTFAHVRYLHAAGFHCLVFDVRGHGDNPPEQLPINVPEFAADTVAAARWLLDRPEVSAVGLLGHSMGGAGVIVAGAAEPRVGAVVSMSAPANMVAMTRRAFAMADMHVPGPVAWPLAWFATRMLLSPRHHSPADTDIRAAAARYRGPLLLLHGAQDRGVPVEHLELIARAAVAARSKQGGSAAPVETLVLPEFGHRWLYEAPEARRKVASFLAGSLGGPVAPDEAAERAAACEVKRPDDPIFGFGALPAPVLTPPPATPMSHQSTAERPDS